VASLFKEGTGRIAKKVIEEAGESAIAGLEGDQEQTIREVADLWFHSIVLLATLDLTPEQVREELRSRRR
jgi:phosphoribosyl-ATP pyrophosphohydrolase